MTDAFTPMPPDLRVERLAAWLREQGDDAPGLIEAATKLLGLDALLLAHGDLQHRLHRLGEALTHEIGRIPTACVGRRAFCVAAAVREIERAVAALRRVRFDRADLADDAADYEKFVVLADEVVRHVAQAEKNVRLRGIFVTRARELIGDIEEALVRVEDADPTWAGWASIDPPRGTVFDRRDPTTSTSATSSPRTPPR